MGHRRPSGIMGSKCDGVPATGSERWEGERTGSQAMERDGGGRDDGGRDGGYLKHHEGTETQAGAGRGLMGGCAREGWRTRCITCV